MNTTNLEKLINSDSEKMRICIRKLGKLERRDSADNGSEFYYWNGYIFASISHKLKTIIVEDHIKGYGRMLSYGTKLSLRAKVAEFLTSDRIILLINKENYKLEKMEER